MKTHTQLRTRKLILALPLFLLFSCTGSTSLSSDEEENSQEQKVSVIYETDIGNDIDDALALDMLYKYQDAGLINLLGISVNKDSELAVQFVDIMNTWYGYPNIPIAKVKNGINDSSFIDFTRFVCEYRNEQGEALKRTLSDYSDISESVEFYRKLLSQQPDASVVIISVGLATNLARLLESPADAYSPLSGKELVARKVKLLSMMGGDFTGGPEPEYNIVQDLGASQTVIREWPTATVYSPFEVGNSILFPEDVVKKDLGNIEGHPLGIAYLGYPPMEFGDRPTWDLTSVLHTVERDKHYFGESETGTVRIDAAGVTVLEPSPDGPHCYLKITNSQAEEIRNRLVELISKAPLAMQ